MSPAPVARARNTSIVTERSPLTVDAAAKPLVPVVAAILRDAQGRVLIAQRPPGKPMAGYWEFPGGKIALGESARQALARELREELAIDIGECRQLLSLRHEYEQFTVELFVWEIEQFDGHPQGIEGQALKWVWPEELRDAQLLPADAPLIEILSQRRHVAGNM